MNYFKTVVFGLLLFLVFVASFLVTWIVMSNTGENPGEEFTTHIQALADEDWELAHSYLHANCGVTVADIENTFSRDGAIDSAKWAEYRIFLHGDDEAFIWFPETAGLQYMVRENGTWLISCENP